jgi:hypothetical protein
MHTGREHHLFNRDEFSSSLSIIFKEDSDFELNQNNGALQGPFPGVSSSL